MKENKPKNIIKFKMGGFENKYWTKRIKDYLVTPSILEKMTINSRMKLNDVTLETSTKFNWFQKLMYKWCFNITVEDYKGGK